jgi:hypothetical protein
MTGTTLISIDYYSVDSNNKSDTSAYHLHAEHTLIEILMKDGGLVICSTLDVCAFGCP